MSTVVSNTALIRASQLESSFSFEADVAYAAVATHFPKLPCHRYFLASAFPEPPVPIEIRRQDDLLRFIEVLREFFSYTLGNALVGKVSQRNSNLVVTYNDTDVDTALDISEQAYIFFVGMLHSIRKMGKVSALRKGLPITYNVFSITESMLLEMYGAEFATVAATLRYIATHQPRRTK